MGTDFNSCLPRTTHNDYVFGVGHAVPREKNDKLKSGRYVMCRREVHVLDTEYISVKIEMR